MAGGLRICRRVDWNASKCCYLYFLTSCDSCACTFCDLWHTLPVFVIIHIRRDFSVYSQGADSTRPVRTGAICATVDGEIGSPFVWIGCQHIRAKAFGLVSLPRKRCRGELNNTSYSWLKFVNSIRQVGHVSGDAEEISQTSVTTRPAPSRSMPGLWPGHCWASLPSFSLKATLTDKALRGSIDIGSYALLSP